MLKHYSNELRRAQEAILSREFQLAYDILAVVRGEINADAKKVKQHRHWCEGCGAGLGMIKEACMCTEE